MAKRAFDIVVAGLLLLLALPLFLAIALAIRLDSDGPVFFRHERIGRGGRPFFMLKFRSMVKDAPSLGPYYTNRDDPRITRVGAFLRRTSLDELPQLINVLKGDMSLVGPRPDVAAQRQLYSEADWRERCSVRPGITGLSQATERSDATRESRLASDLDYVRRHSVLRDIRILAMTLRQVVTKASF